MRDKMTTNKLIRFGYKKNRFGYGKNGTKRSIF